MSITFGARRTIFTIHPPSPAMICRPHGARRGLQFIRRSPGCYLTKAAAVARRSAYDDGRDVCYHTSAVATDDTTRPRPLVAVMALLSFVAMAAGLTIAAVFQALSRRETLYLGRPIGPIAGTNPVSDILSRGRALCLCGSACTRNGFGQLAIVAAVHHDASRPERASRVAHRRRICDACLSSISFDVRRDLHLRLLDSGYSSPLPPSACMSAVILA